MKKIMIFGRPGSGKSILAAQLSSLLHLPVHHLDKHFFEAGWVEKNTADFLQIQKELVNHDQWIIDGNSSKSLEIRWSKAEVIIFMNYPRWRCYYRVIKRYLFPNTHIDDRAPGCKEVLRWALLKYMWRYNDRIAPTIHFLKAKYPSSTFYAISNNTETRCLIQHLKGDT